MPLSLPFALICKKTFDAIWRTVDAGCERYMNTVGKMTGAVGKGLTSLTMDDGYMTERRAEAAAEDVCALPHSLSCTG